MINDLEGLNIEEIKLPLNFVKINLRKPIILIFANCMTNVTLVL